MAKKVQFHSMTKTNYYKLIWFWDQNARKEKRRKWSGLAPPLGMPGRQQKESGSPIVSTRSPSQADTRENDVEHLLKTMKTWSNVKLHLCSLCWRVTFFFTFPPISKASSNHPPPWTNLCRKFLSSRFHDVSRFSLCPRCALHFDAGLLLEKPGPNDWSKILTSKNQNKVIGCFVSS